VTTADLPVPRRFDRRPPERDTTRINERIRVPEVRLIDETGAQMGVMATDKALRYAQDKDLDLVDYRVLRVVSAMLMPFILLFALYVLFHGDFGPGGGFQAGVIFASGFVLYGLVFGLDKAQQILPKAVLWSLIPLGLLMFVGVGVATVLLGGSFLDYDILSPGDPAAGQHLGILLVESAIGLTVAAVMTSIFFSFANRRATQGVPR